MKKTLPIEVWEQRIEDYRNSGMSLAKWCEANDVKKSTMSYYLYGRKKKEIVAEEPETKEVVAEEMEDKNDAAIKCDSKSMNTDRKQAIVPVNLFREKNASPVADDDAVVVMPPSSLHLNLNGITIDVDYGTNLEFLKNVVEVLR